MSHVNSLWVSVWGYVFLFSLMSDSTKRKMKGRNISHQHKDMQKDKYEMLGRQTKIFFWDDRMLNSTPSPRPQVKNDIFLIKSENQNCLNSRKSKCQFCLLLSYQDQKDSLFVCRICKISSLATAIVPSVYDVNVVIVSFIPRALPGCSNSNWTRSNSL